MIAKLFNFQSKTIASAAVLLVGAALASRLLGIVRDRMLTGRFGAGEELDAYLTAFRIPDFLYAFLVIWGLSAVFLPLFSEHMEKGKEKAWKFANNMMNAYAMFLGVGSLVAFFFMPQLISLIAPGFEGSQFQTAVSLSRLMLLSPLFFAFSAVTAGVLQYFQKFVAYALAPILYNLGIILGIVFFAPTFGIFGVAIGVVMGAAAHFLIQIPSLLSTGFAFKLEISLFDAQVRKAFLLSLPRTIAGVAHQINLIVMIAFASLLPVGSITMFTLAEHMYYFPIGIIGIPLATAAFPILAKAIARTDVSAFLSAFASTLWRIVLVALPIAVILFLVKEPLFRLLYMTGEFTSENVHIASSVFGIFTLGIVFQSSIPLLVRAFFALQNTIFPTIAGISAVALNIALAFVFLKLGWGIFALPWALVVSGIFQSLMLSLLLFLVVKRSTQ